MRQTSALYKTLQADPGHVKQSRLIIGNVVYDESQIVTLNTNEALFAENTLSIGGAIAREIDFAAFLDESVPKRAQIIHEVRLITSTQASEWLQKGVYYISTRSKDPLTGVTTVHGFDAMMSAEQEWKPAQTDIFPMPMKDAIEKTAAILHLALDPRNVYKTGEDYKVSYPVADGNASEEEQVKGLSIRQVWRWIAAAMGGNFIINDLGELRLVPVNDSTATAYLSDENGDAVTFGGNAILLQVASADSPELSALGNAAASVQQFPAFEAISRVILKIGGDQGYVSGSDTGRTIEIDCAYGSQTMANDLLAQLQGYVYQPMQADDALIDPAAELGDPVEVCGVYAVLAQKDTLWDMLSAADIAAPGGTGPEDEYGFLSAAASRAQYELAQARSLIAKTNDRVTIEIYGEDGKGGLNGRMNTFTMGLSGISVQIQGYQNTLNGYEKQLADYQFGLDGFSADLKTYSEDVNRYTEQVGNYAFAVDKFDLQVAEYGRQAEAYTKEYTAISGKIGSLSLEVTNGDATASIQLKVDGQGVGNPATIEMTGLVTFTALGGNYVEGQTKINGGWIDTDTLTVNAAKVTGTLSIGTMPNGVARTSDIPTKVGDLKNDKKYQTETGVTNIVEGIVTTDYLYALGVSATYLRGQIVTLADKDDDEVGGIDLYFYDQKETVDLYSHEVLRLTGGTSVSMIYGDGEEYIAVGDGGAQVSNDLTSAYAGSLGLSTMPWDVLYAESCSCCPSDANRKNSIEDLPEKYLMLFDHLKPKRFKFNKGKSGRYHPGYIAQDVKAAMDEVGIDSSEFGGWVMDIDEEGNEIYMLRYEEFGAIYAAKIKQLEARVAELEVRV